MKSINICAFAAFAVVALSLSVESVSAENLKLQFPGVSIEASGINVIFGGFKGSAGGVGMPN